MSGISRRKVIGAGVGALGIAGAVGAGAAGVVGFRQDGAGSGDAIAPDSYPFFGSHQSGIITPAQDHLHFASFDVTTAKATELVQLLTEWTAAAEAMMAGRPIGETGAIDGQYAAPPEDTGEALGLTASRLTITFGFGPGLFTNDNGRHFGLTKKQPAHLQTLPHFPADNLSPQRSDGDLCIQACADDPQVAVHAIRNLARIGFGKVAIRWSQLGFGRTSSTSRAQVTPRNLFGFKDGTNNLKTEDSDDLLDDQVWVQPIDGTDWLAGGSYLVARRINMRLETWDRTSLKEQEQVIGRTKGTGSPLSGGDEFDGIDFEMKGRGDQPIVAANAHVRLAAPANNGGAHMLRRGYNFTDGTDGFGRLDAGLFFIAFVRNPATQYIPMQTKLSKEDGLMEYLQHTGSGLFAVAPGVPGSGRFIGDTLFS